MPDFPLNDPPQNFEEIAQEVAAAIESHEGAVANILNDRELFLDMYKGTNYTAYKVKQRHSLSNLPSPVIAEATETLTNTIYAMLTAADPNFSLVSLSGAMDDSALFKNTNLLRMQQDKTKRKRKLMAAVRSLVLNGSAFVEQPWISWPPGDPDPAWEATDFIHRPFPNMFWMPRAISIDYADYIGSVDIISANRLKALAEMDQEGTTWNKFMVAVALKETEMQDYTGTEIRQSLTSLGYSDFKGLKELATYYGPLQSVDGGRSEWVVGLLNRKFVVRFHKSIYPRGLRPFRFAKHIELENDPLGIGVGHQLQFQQRYINSNLNRTMDIITMATFGIKLANRYAGFKTDDFKLSPLALWEGDDINGIKDLPVSSQAAAEGLKLHEFLIEQARNHSGATPTLQAIITEASASEVKIAQSNSMRAVSAKAELIGEEFIREAVYFDNYNNYLFLDAPIWMRAVGMNRPQLIYPSDISKNIDVMPRIVTDKDYVPQAIKNDLELLKILTSIRSALPPDTDPTEVIVGLVRRLNHDPSKIFPSKFTPRRANLQSLMGLANKESASLNPISTAGEQFVQAEQGVNQIAAA